MQSVALVDGATGEVLYITVDVQKTPAGKLALISLDRAGFADAAGLVALRQCCDSALAELGYYGSADGTGSCTSNM